VPLEEMLVDEATPEPADVVVSAETVLEMEGTLSDTLSALELQVLRLHRSGRSYAEIARALNRNTKAVDNTLQRIKRKLERRLQAPSSEGAP
jgi:RNA polymerase sporulation-specific sigma factor